MDVKPKCPMSRGGFECGNFDLEKYKAAFNDGYSNALQQCREAVEKVECPDMFHYGIRLALAAISRVEMGIK